MSNIFYFYCSKTAHIKSSIFDFIGSNIFDFGKNKFSPTHAPYELTSRHSKSPHFLHSHSLLSLLHPINSERNAFATFVLRLELLTYLLKRNAAASYATAPSFNMLTNKNLFKQTQKIFYKKYLLCVI